MFVDQRNEQVPLRPREGLQALAVLVEDKGWLQQGKGVITDRDRGVGDEGAVSRQGCSVGNREKANRDLKRKQLDAQQT